MYETRERAKEYSIDANSKKYPMYFFKTDTSGEKAYEEFYTEEEELNLIEYSAIGYIKTNDIEISFKDVVSDFKKVFQGNKSSKSSAVKVLQKYLPDFRHLETGKNLDQKM